MFKKLIITTTALSVSALLSVSAYAMSAVHKVEVEHQVKQANGDVTFVTTPTDKVLPGDTIVYTVDFHNDKNEVTENFRIEMGVPAEMIYLEGTALRDDTIVLYSVDGGSNYQVREELSVRVAEGGTRPAVAEDITNIRWTLTEKSGISVDRSMTDPSAARAGGTALKRLSAPPDVVGPERPPFPPDGANSDPFTRRLIGLGAVGA